MQAFSITKYFRLLDTILLLLLITTISNASTHNIIGGDTNVDEKLKEITVIVNLKGNKCTGSYIGNNKVATAAHCAIVGVNSVSFYKPNGLVNTCATTKTHIHPEYDDQLTLNDIAVIQFECKNEPAPRNFFHLHHNQSPFNTKVMGYGFQYLNSYDVVSFKNASQIESIPFDLSNTLDFPEVTSKPEVLDFYKLLIDYQSKGAFRCYQASKLKTSYYGDSGGPEYFKDSNGNLILFGVTSRGLLKNDSMDSLFASCSLRVSFYLDWINSL